MSSNWIEAEHLALQHASAAQLSKLLLRSPCKTRPMGKYSDSVQCDWISICSLVWEFKKQQPKEEEEGAQKTATQKVGVEVELKTGVTSVTCSSSLQSYLAPVTACLADRRTLTGRYKNTESSDRLCELPPVTLIWRLSQLWLQPTLCSLGPMITLSWHVSLLKQRWHNLYSKAEKKGQSAQLTVLAVEKLTG